MIDNFGFWKPQIKGASQNLFPSKCRDINGCEVYDIGQIGHAYELETKFKIMWLQTIFGMELSVHIKGFIILLRCYTKNDA